jgi:chemotaxis protein MotA
MKQKTDLSTIIGLVLAFGSIMGSIVLEHGSIMAYVNVSAGMIVFGGCFGIALIAFPMSVVKKLPILIMKSFKQPVGDAAPIVKQFVHLAGRARKEGLLALEQEVASIEHPLLKKGISMVVDGTDPEVVKAVMQIDVAAREARHEVGISMLEAIGGYAPALGIVGTVLGLIRILAHLSAASELAAAISVAFTATLYGVGSANLIWLPLAGKLKRRSAEEAELNSLIIDGVEAIQNGDNPHVVEEKLAGYLTPAKGKGKKATSAQAAAAQGVGAPSKAGA